MRAIVLVPYVISMLVGSLLLKWLFSSDGGIMPLVLSPIGLGQATILGYVVESPVPEPNSLEPSRRTYHRSLDARPSSAA